MYNPNPQENYNDLVKYKKLKDQGFNFPNLLIKNAGYKGLGVFTTQDIKENSIVEFSHAVMLNNPSNYTTDQSIRRYAYTLNCSCEDCKKHGQKLMIPFGYGAIYNSADKQEEKNCDFYILSKEKVFVYRASRDIKAGEEILLWFGEKYYNAWCKKYIPEVNVN
jgi:hypothetical protein